MWKFGVCASGNDLDELKKLKDAGADFFELGFSDLAKKGDEEFEKTLDFVKELGVPVVSMNCLIVGDFYITGEKTNHDLIAEFVEKGMERAVKFGTKNFVMGSGKARSVPEGFSPERAREQVESLVCDKLLPIFKKYDVILSVEELRKEETNIFNSCREVAEFVRRVNRPNLKLLVDYYHAILGGDTTEEIASYGDIISHVHIASPLNQRHIPMKDDGDDYVSFLDALKKANYKAGYVSLEGGCGGKDKAETVKQSLEYLKSLNR